MQCTYPWIIFYANEMALFLRHIINILLIKLSIGVVLKIRESFIDPTEGVVLFNGG